MAVTVSYSLQSVGVDFTFPSYASDASWTELDLATRHFGGILAVGNHGGSAELDIYGAAFDAPEQGHGTYSGTAPAVTELKDGSVFIASATADGDIVFSYVTAGGATTLSQTGVLATDSIKCFAPDAAGLKNGNVAIALETNSVAHDAGNLSISIRGADNHSVNFFNVDSGLNDQAPSICALNDGGFAVAWTAIGGDGNSSVWTAVYEANGNLRDMTEIDGSGAINRDVSVVALADGGFGVAYEENSVRATGDLQFVHMDANNDIVGGGRVNVTAGDLDGIPPSEASATLLSNGWVAISYTLDYGGGDEDIRMRVVDPTTNTMLDTFSDVDVDGHHSHASSIAALNQGSMVVGWSDDTDGNQGHQYNMVRTTTGILHQANTLTGDSLVDHMTGGTKADVMDGGAGDDALSGGGGKDILIGGDGSDQLDGGGGKDTASYASATAGIFADLLGSGGDGDTYISIENLTGSRRGDTLSGSNGANVLDGGNGDDSMQGRGGRDLLLGGNGNDQLLGGDNADTLTGGDGVDAFYYVAASESSSLQRDTITDLNFAQDGFVLPTPVAATEGTLTGGHLSKGTFDADLSAAMAALGKHHAVMFAPDSGNLAGHLFLVVDLNKQTGYQADHDLVIDITGATHLSSFGMTNFVTAGLIVPPVADAGHGTPAPVLAHPELENEWARAIGHAPDFGAHHFFV